MLMRRLPSLRALLIAAALLSMQWLGVAHALEHSPLAPEKVCSLCTLGVHLDSGVPLPASPPVPHWLAAQPIAAAIGVVESNAVAGRPHARGPPSSLV